jgi:hypothetical protein
MAAQYLNVVTEASKQKGCTYLFKEAVAGGPTSCQGTS